MMYAGQATFAWGQAFVLSVATHAAVVWAVFAAVQPDTSLAVIPPQPAATQISVTVLPETSMPGVGPVPDDGVGQSPDAIEASQNNATSVDEVAAATPAPVSATFASRNTVPRHAQPVRPVSPVIQQDARTAASAQAQTPIMTSPDAAADLTPRVATPINPAMRIDGTTAVRIAPVQIGAGSLVTGTPQPPRLAATATASPELTAMRTLISLIRNTPGDPCLAAYPQMASPPRVTMIAAQERAAAAFGITAFAELNPAPALQTLLIDARQCPAIDFMRDHVDYPALGLGLALDTDRIVSGERLSGHVEGGAGRFVSLLLIDDNGVVQDLRRFLSFSDGRVSFDLPVTRSGRRRDTAQLLIALATDGPSVALATQDGQLARDLFPALQSEIGTSAVLAIVPFTVR